MGAAAAAGLGWLARTGCTSTSDHHYVFPRDGGDVLGATVEAAREVGLRFHPTRGSMDLGRSRGGLPPDSVVETTEAALAGTLRALDAHHDPSPGSMLRMGVAPCSPFSVTEDLMREAAALARDRGVRLHTHLAETLDEDTFCRSTYDCTPTEYAERLGWLGDDVWLAHCVHVDDAAMKRLAASGTAVAHCPTSNARLGAGLAPVAALPQPDVAVGLGVDGSASNEESSLVTELHAAVMVARLRGGPGAMTAREALALGTIGGARVLGRADEIGSLEAGQARRHRAVAARRARPRRLRGPGRRAGARVPAPAGPAAGRRRDGRRGRRTADGRRARPRPPCGRGHPHPAGEERAMTSAPTGARSRTRDGVGESAAAARRRAQGARRVRVLLRPLDGRDAVGRHAAQPARPRADHRHPHRGRARRARRLRGAHP